MINSYKDLEVYKLSYDLVKVVHEMTLKYPEYEKYEMGSQLRRAAMSIPINIAEGYGKKDSAVEFKRYLRMSLGSINECNVLINLSNDFGYISQEEYDFLNQQYDILGKRMNSLITKWK